MVFQYSVLITLVAVAAPLVVVGLVLSFIPGMTTAGYIVCLSIAGLIPLLIAPPIAWFGLSLVRIMSETIERVDARIRFDPLTGIFHRAHFLDQVRAANVGGALMIVDADKFKLLNDTHGHDAGDTALVAIANTLMLTVGEHGFVGRLGGEEFIVFLPGASPSVGLEIAEQIRINIAALDPMVSGRKITMTVSVGITMHPRNAIIGTTLKKADIALYRAKEAGRNRVIDDFSNGAVRRVA